MQQPQNQLGSVPEVSHEAFNPMTYDEARAREVGVWIDLREASLGFGRLERHKLAGVKTIRLRCISFLAFASIVPRVGDR